MDKVVPDLLNNINHFPNNLQKQYYHHTQKLRPWILLPVSFLVHVGVHLSDLLLQHVHLLLHHLPVRHHPNNIHNLLIVNNISNTILPPPSSAPSPSSSSS